MSRASFDFDTVFLFSCRTVDEVCRYIIHDFIPAEYQKTRLGRLSNELSEDRRDLERLIRLHRKFVSDVRSDEQGKSK